VKHKWIDLKQVAYIIVVTLLIYLIFSCIAYVLTPKERDMLGINMKGKIRFLPRHKIDQQTEDAKEYYNYARDQLNEALANIQNGNNNYAMTLIKNALRNMENMRNTLWMIEH
jgi:hypothetical protein